MSDRHAVLLVARREFTERLRDRSFQISTAIMLAVVIAVAVLAGVLGGHGVTHYDVGVVGSNARTVATQAQSEASAAKARVTIVPLTSVAQARTRVSNGDLPAALVPGARVLTPANPDTALLQLLQSAARRIQAASILQAAGVGSATVAQTVSAPGLAVQSASSASASDRGLANAASFVLYAQLVTYGLWVATGVVEEKSSRVVEVLLAKIRPRALVIGKVVGLGLLGLVQMLAIAAVGLGTALASGALKFSGTTPGALGVVLLWFLLGYGLIAWLYAVGGVAVSRQEDLQSTTTPVTLLFVVTFLIGISAIRHPAGTLAVVTSLVPLSAPIVMPARIVLGQVGALQIALSLVLLVATIALLVPLAVRIYEGAVLRTGRPMRFKEALSAART